MILMQFQRESAIDFSFHFMPEYFDWATHLPKQIPGWQAIFRQMLFLREAFHIKAELNPFQAFHPGYLDIIHSDHRIGGAPAGTSSLHGAY